MNQLEIDSKDISLLIGGLTMVRRETVAALLGIKKVGEGEHDNILLEVYNRTQRLLKELTKAKETA